MIPIAISVAVVAWAVIASVMAVNLRKRLKAEQAFFEQKLERIVQQQSDLTNKLLNGADRQILRQETELTKLRKAAQKRGANGQYIKK